VIPIPAVNEPRHSEPPRRTRSEPAEKTPRPVLAAQESQASARTADATAREPADRQRGGPVADRSHRPSSGRRRDAQAMGPAADRATQRLARAYGRVGTLLDVYA